MRMSSREALLVWATGLAALAGLTYWFVDPRVKTWKETVDTRDTIARRIVLARSQQQQRPEWDWRMHDLLQRVSQYPADRDVIADYLKTLERLAKDNNLALIQRKPQKEKKHGELYELTIDCTWEGELEALIRFLYALETENVTMDIDDLTVALIPGGKGKMKGNFALLCIYSRSTDKRAAAITNPAPTVAEQMPPATNPAPMVTTNPAPAGAKTK